MNKLQRYIADSEWTELEAMNLLQERSGLISDCCVWAADVAGSDCEKAVQWLRIQAAKRAALACK